MNFALYRSISHLEPLSDQERGIFSCAEGMECGVDEIFVDFSPLGKPLEERVQAHEFILGMQQRDRLFVHDLWVLSGCSMELVKIFTCLFKKEIRLCVASKKVVLEKHSPSFLVLGMMHAACEDLGAEKKHHLGRPRGSISRSKFDHHRMVIIERLREGVNVCEIAREIGVNRSSLKDYITSRRLKEIALAATSPEQRVYLEEGMIQSSSESIMRGIECPFEEEKARLRARAQATTRSDS